MFSPPPLEGFPANPFAADPAGKCLAALRDAVGACQADGYLPDMEAGQVAFMLWSAVHGAAVLALRGQRGLHGGLLSMQPGTLIVPLTVPDGRRHPDCPDEDVAG